MHARDAPQLAGLHELDDAAIVGVVVVNVVAHLGDALVLQRGVRHHPPLADAVAEGLLDEHVLARLHRPDGRQGVPVIGRDDGDRVDFLVVQDAAEVAERLRLVPARLLDFGDRAIDVRAIDVADRADAHVGMLEEVAEAVGAHAADADQTHDDLIVGLLAREDAPVQRGQRQPSRDRTQEPSARNRARFYHHRSSQQWPAFGSRSDREPVLAVKKRRRQVLV